MKLTERTLPILRSARAFVPGLVSPQQGLARAVRAAAGSPASLAKVMALYDGAKTPVERVQAGQSLLRVAAKLEGMAQPRAAAALTQAVRDKDPDSFAAALTAAQEHYVQKACRTTKAVAIGLLVGLGNTVLAMLSGPLGPLFGCIAAIDLGVALCVGAKGRHAAARLAALGALAGALPAAGASASAA